MTNRTAVKIIFALSAVAIGFLFWIIYGVEAAPGSTGWEFLPAMNALMNALSATSVLVGLYFIRKGNKRAHGISMAAALTASTVFLAGYILHHSLHGDTKFLGEGWIRPVYFFILISHILLSIVALPLVLATVYFAAVKHWSTHRIVARFTYPIWLYVSVTGVLVFIFLRGF